MDARKPTRQERMELRERRLKAWSQLDYDEVIALKATAFDLLLDSIPTVANGYHGDEEIAERAQTILDLPVPPKPTAPEDGDT